MTKEKLRRNALFLILPLLAALLSFFVLAGIASSPEFHKHSIAALEEKQTTVLELSAASAAASAAICAANGVDLREPLKPTVPADCQEITLPWGSVMETMVLLNVDLM